MAINPELITTIRVDQLPDETLSLTNLFPHTVGTDLKSSTIQELVDLVATTIGVSGGIGYVAISVTDGQQLPNVPELPSFFLCGAGTYLNINGYPDVICTDELNAVMSLTDHWQLAVGIPIVAEVGVQTVTGSAVDNTDPLNPVINEIINGVQTIVAGTNISVDNTDPANPIVSSTGGGGTPTLQEVLDNNHDLVDGNFFVGTLAGDGNSGTYVIGIGDSALRDNTTDYIVAIGSEAGFENTGTGLSVLGVGGGYQNSGDNVVAIGLGAGIFNTFNNVNLFGTNATADENGQTVLSKDGTIMARISTIDLTATRKYNLPNASGTLALTSDIPSSSTFVPYTGATADVNLGTHKLLAKDLDINHASGSGDAATITKGGSGEALKVVKTSGSGNAASVTGGVTLLDELHLTTDLADDYIASAATWNAKQDALGYIPASVDDVGNLIREEFTFTSSQTFTLANNYGQVYSVEVQGQGSLSSSQYTLVAPNQITILDTLDSGDYITVLYSNAITGVQPYYSQAEVDSIINNLPRGLHNRIVITGQVYNNALNSITTSTGTTAVNRLEVSPLINFNNLVVNQLAINVSVAAVGALARIVVYSDLNGTPNTKLLESPDLDCSTLGFKKYIVDYTFQKGVTYWIGAHFNSLITIRVIPLSGLMSLGMTGDTNPMNTAWRATPTYGSSSPNPFTGGTLVSVQAPEIKLYT
jgi:hypothetical protein